MKSRPGIRPPRLRDSDAELNFFREEAIGAEGYPTYSLCEPLTFSWGRCHMPLRCPCGNENPDESTYCNKCGTKLQLKPRGPRTCSTCHHENAAHVAYCGKCGEDLDRGYAKITHSGEYLPSLVPDDAYVAGTSIPSLYSGRLYSTKQQFTMGLIISIPFYILLALLFFLEGGWLLSLIWCVFGAALLYFGWRVGRKRAGHGD